MPGYSGGSGGGGSGDALTTNPLSQFAATTSAQLRGVISDETGSGALVFATSPTLVTPALGTPSSGTLTNCTGLPTAGLVDDAVSNAKAANMAANTIKGRATASTGDPEDLTPAQARTVISEEQTATAGSSVTTLTLTPSATLTDGFYEALISIKSLNTSAVFRFYINGDTTNSNYRVGNLTSQAAAASGSEASDTFTYLADNGYVVNIRIILAIKNGYVTAQSHAARIRSVGSAGRAYLASLWHTTATDISSIQITSDTASTIASGSVIIMRRIG